MSTTVLACPPSVIEAGTTVEFYLSGCFSTLLWTAQIYLNDGVHGATAVNATIVSAQFKAAISASITDALTPGRYAWGEYYTNIADTAVKKMGQTGALEVIPGIIATATPSTAQLMVTGIETALKKLGSQQFSTASFNGQTYTRTDVAKLRAELVSWQAQVIRERARTESLRGNHEDGMIAPNFVTPGYGYGSEWERR